jgi:hypothetical protein
VGNDKDLINVEVFNVALETSGFVGGGRGGKGALWVLLRLRGRACLLVRVKAHHRARMHNIKAVSRNPNMIGFLREVVTHR